MSLRKVTQTSLVITRLLYYFRVHSSLAGYHLNFTGVSINFVEIHAIMPLVLAYMYQYASILLVTLLIIIMILIELRCFCVYLQLQMVLSVTALVFLTTFFNLHSSLCLVRIDSMSWSKQHNPWHIEHIETLKHTTMLKRQLTQVYISKSYN